MIMTCDRESFDYISYLKRQNNVFESFAPNQPNRRLHSNTLRVGAIMAVSSPVVVSLKTLFSVLAVIMLALAVWGVGSDGLASCVDIRKK